MIEFNRNIFFPVAVRTEEGVAPAAPATVSGIQQVGVHKSQNRDETCPIHPEGKCQFSLTTTVFLARRKRARKTKTQIFPK